MGEEGWIKNSVKAGFCWIFPPVKRAFSVLSMADVLSPSRLVAGVEIAARAGAGRPGRSLHAKGQGPAPSPSSARPAHAWQARHRPLRRPPSPVNPRWPGRAVPGRDGERGLGVGTGGSSPNHAPPAIILRGAADAPSSWRRPSARARRRASWASSAQGARSGGRVAITAHQQQQRKSLVEFNSKGG